MISLCRTPYSLLHLAPVSHTPPLPNPLFITLLLQLRRPVLPRLRRAARAGCDGFSHCTAVHGPHLLPWVGAFSVTDQHTVTSHPLPLPFFQHLTSPPIGTTASSTAARSGRTTTAYPAWRSSGRIRTSSWRRSATREPTPNSHHRCTHNMAAYTAPPPPPSFPTVCIVVFVQGAGLL